jgi:hypothetical protein
MDTLADPNITFNEEGVCKYFAQYHDRVSKFFIGGEKGKDELEKVFNRIKEEREKAKSTIASQASAEELIART